MTSHVESEQKDSTALLMSLCERLGIERVLADLDVSPDELAHMMIDSASIPVATLDRIRRVQSVLENGRIDALGVDAEPITEKLESTVEVDLPEDSEELLPDGYQPRTRSGSNARDAVEQLKADLYRVRMMALRQRVGLALREDEKLANHLFVIQIELTLILEFGESVPEPGLGWNGVTLDAEAEKRFRRRDRLQGELAKYTTGVRGIFRRLSGRRPLTLGEVMDSMVRDAEAVHQASTLASDSTQETLTRLLAPSGFDADSVRELIRQNSAVVPG